MQLFIIRSLSRLIQKFSMATNFIRNRSNGPSLLKPICRCCIFMLSHQNSDKSDLKPTRHFQSAIKHTQKKKKIWIIWHMCVFFICINVRLSIQQIGDLFMVFKLQTNVCSVLITACLPYNDFITFYLFHLALYDSGFRSWALFETKNPSYPTHTLRNQNACLVCVWLILRLNFMFFGV